MVYIAIALLILTLILGMPVPISFMASCAFLIFFGGPNGGGYNPDQLLPYGFSQMNSTILIAVAMFIISGGIMERGKIADKLIDLVDVFVGHLKGGLGIVGAISCAIFGSICGAACATLACIGAIMIPRFEKAGYPRGHTAALMASSSLLGLLIPPNTVLILFSYIAGLSVLECFLSTAVPGIIAILLISLINMWLLRNNESLLVVEKRTIHDRYVMFKERGRLAIPALFMPVIVLGGVYGGVITTSEAASLAALYTIPVGLYVYRGLTYKALYSVIVESSVTIGVIMVMLFSVSMVSRLYIMEDLPGKILYLFRMISNNKWVIMLLINIFLIVMGMIMDDASVVILTTPILMPVIRELGFNPIHYAAVLGINVAVACITPPAAPVLYLAGRLCNTSIDTMMRPTLWIIALCWIPLLLITSYIPKVSLFLPHMILGSPW